MLQVLKKVDFCCAGPQGSGCVIGVVCADAAAVELWALLEPMELWALLELIVPLLKMIELVEAAPIEPLDPRLTRLLSPA